jgi:hypothetical protein
MRILYIYGMEKLALETSVFSVDIAYYTMFSFHYLRNGECIVR